jgi:hypothetical protein
MKNNKMKKQRQAVTQAGFRIAGLEVATSVAIFGLLGLSCGLSHGAASADADAPSKVNAAAPARGSVASGDALAKKLANPIASMISVPFQNNFDWGGGPNGDGFQWKMNIQPVIPFHLNDDWNLITRTIIPVISQKNIIGTTSQSGLSDTLLAAWFSPKEPTSNGWILGAGPALLFPTGTDDLLTANQWGAGPTAIALRQQGKFTYGALANHVWSYAGSGGRAQLNQTFLQPFFTYLPGGGWTYAINTESSYDWAASQWTIPINVSVSKMILIKETSTQWQVGARYYAAKPDNGPNWGLRFNVTIIIPES